MRTHYPICTSRCVGGELVSPRTRQGTVLPMAAGPSVPDAQWRSLTAAHTPRRAWHAGPPAPSALVTAPSAWRPRSPPSSPHVVGGWEGLSDSHAGGGSRRRRDPRRRGAGRAERAQRARRRTHRRHPPATPVRLHARSRALPPPCAPVRPSAPSLRCAPGGADPSPLPHPAAPAPSVARPPLGRPCSCPPRLPRAVLTAARDATLTTVVGGRH